MINDYIARQVAAKDMQPCLICSKPTVTVLYNASGPDWLYTCDIHLHDNPHFATPIYNAEYQEALDKLKMLKAQVGKLSAADKPASWDGWVSQIFIKKPKKDDEDENENEDKDKDKELKNQADEKKQADSLKECQQKYNQQIDLVTSLQKKSRRYKLSDVTFNSRVQRKKNERIQAERRRKEQEMYSTTDPEEIAKKFAFPTVPNNNIK